MINVNRLRYMIDELRNDEEYIQWIDNYYARLAIRGDIIHLLIVDSDVDKRIQRVFTRDQFDLSKVNILPLEIEDMLKELKA